MNCTSVSGKKRYIPVSFDDYALSNFKEIFFGGEYEVNDLKNVKTFIDAGANTGMASLYFSLTNHIEEAVLIEANPSLIQDINLNFKQNFSDIKVTVLNKCISSIENSSIDFYIAENHRDSGVHSLAQANKKISVQTVTFAQVLSGMSADAVDLLKIDIEGAEHDLIGQNPNCFKSFKYVLAEVHGNREVCSSFIQKMESAGFQNRILFDHVETHSCLNLYSINLNNKAF